MSRHWNPEGELDRTRQQSPRQSWPRGATAGVALVAAACVGVAIAAYRLAGPRDVFEDDSAIDWSQMPAPPVADPRD